MNIRKTLLLIILISSMVMPYSGNKNITSSHALVTTITTIIQTALFDNIGQMKSDPVGKEGIIILQLAPFLERLQSQPAFKYFVIFGEQKEVLYKVGKPRLNEMTFYRRDWKNEMLQPNIKKLKGSTYDVIAPLTVPGWNGYIGELHFRIEL